MIIAGHSIKGHTHIGKSTIESIGAVIFHYDYRFNAVISSGRVSSWGDLGPHGINLTAEGFRRLYSSADGFGDGGNAVTVLMTAAFKTPLNILHNGSPYLWFAVVNFPAAPTALARMSFTSMPASTPGQVMEIVNTTGVFRCTVQDASDTAIITSSTAAIPTNENILLMRQYYGSGTGSNNAKSWVKSTLTQATSNPTFSSANCGPLLLGKGSAGSGDNWKIKTVGAYDLTGKSSAQIDTFRDLFITTLKSDTEYSSLVTP